VAVAWVLAGCGAAQPHGGALGAAQPPGTTLPASQQLLGAAIAYDPGTGSVIAFGGQRRSGRWVGPSALTWRWTGQRWQPVATKPPPARSTALMAADPAGRGLLMFGGQAERYTLPSCPTPYTSGQPCSASISPVQLLSDTWAFASGGWRRLPAGPDAPAQGQLLAADPALDAIVLTGQSAPGGLGAAGTWKWAGHGWRLLCAANPEQADSMAYDPVTGRLLAYGGMQPFSPPAGSEAPVSPGYSQTWTLTGAGWVQLHPATIPGRVSGVLTQSPNQGRLLLITSLGQVWAWTGQRWQRYPSRGGPAGATWTNATLAAATDPSRHQVVLLATNNGMDDQTWTLTGSTWARAKSTP
jgi:hypothetical protein